MNVEQMQIKFIADIHISPTTVKDLKAIGYIIQRVDELLPATALDSEIIELATKERAVIITQDLDFSEIIMQYGLKKPSIISLRLNKPYPQSVTNILLQLIPKIEKELLAGCIFSVTENQVRIRKLEID